MSAELFINKLEELGLFEEKLIGRLRSRVAQPGKKPSAASIARYLIDKDQLTEVQAKKLLNAYKQETEKKRESKKSGKKKKSEKPRPMPDEVEVVEVELEEVELEEVELEAAEVVDVELEEVELEEAEVVEVVDDVAEVEVVEMEVAAPSRRRKRDALEAPESIEEMDLVDGAVETEPSEVVEAVYESASDEERENVSFKGKRDGGNQWDSKWVLLLPGVLVILALSGALLYWVLTSKSADEQWTAAEDAYDNQNYVTSMELHEEFIVYNKDDARAKIAAARLRMAKIRMPFESKRWEKALGFFQEELPELVNDLALIEDTSEQSNIRMELAAMLPDNAQGFVDKADKQDSIEEAKRLLALSDQNIELVNSGANIPKSLRELPVIKKKIDQLKESAARVSRKVDREDELVAGLAKIKTMSDEDDTQGAAMAYDGLLRVYPELMTEPRLLTAIRELSKKHQTLVKKIDVSLPVSTEQKVADSKPVVLATRVGKEVRGLKGRIHALLVKGAVYGIDIGAGKVAWRHFVGYETQINPLILDLGRPMVIVGDLSANELRALDLQTGELVWRTEIGEEFFTPLLIEDQLYVSTAAGRILQIDVVDGASGLVTKIPQPLISEAAPFVSGGRRRLLQVGDQTNLYLFGATDMSCKEAYFLGHQRGAIQVPPLVLAGHILIAENRPNRRSNLHVLKIGEDGLLQLAQNGVPMGGHVHSPLRLYGRRAMVITDSGEIRLFELDPSPKQAIKMVAETKLDLHKELTTRYIPVEGKLWVADRGITRFDIQTQKGELARQAVSNSLDEFVGPLAMFPEDQVLLHVRRRRGSSLISVAAADAETNAEYWRLDFAAPLAGGPFMEQDSKQLVAANCQGDFFPLNAESIDAGFAGQPLLRASTAEQDLNFPFQVDLGEGSFAFIGDSSQKRFLYFKPGRTRPMQMVDLNNFDYQLSGQPINVGGNALIASRDGMVQLIDPASPTKASKFLPEKKANSVFDWQTAAAVNKNSVVLAERKGGLFLLEKNRNSLRQKEQIKHDQKFVRPPAVIGGHVATATTDGRKHNFTTFELPEMSRKLNLELKSSVVFGPFAVNDAQAIVATDQGQVLCVDSTAKEVWSVELKDGIITGATVADERVVLTTLNGKIYWLMLSDGSTIAELDMNEPTIPDNTFPVVHDGSLFVGTADGTVHVSQAP